MSVKPMVNQQISKEHLDQVYPEAEFQKDLMHHDVVSHYQNELEQEFGHSVDYLEAEDVAYGWTGTLEERIERLRQKFAWVQSPDGSKQAAPQNSSKAI